MSKSRSVTPTPNIYAPLNVLSSGPTTPSRSPTDDTTATSTASAPTTSRESSDSSPQQFTHFHSFVSSQFASPDDLIPRRPTPDSPPMAKRMRRQSPEDTSRSQSSDSQSWFQRQKARRPGSQSDHSQTGQTGPLQYAFFPNAPPPYAADAVDSTPAQPPRLRVQPIAPPAQITGITAVALNPALRADFGAGAPRSAHLGIGVDFAARTLNNVDGDCRLWAEPATCPGLPALTLTSALLPWVVTAHASGGCVTVGDILQAIHRTLSIRVTEEEFRECMEGPRLDYMTEQMPQEPVSPKNVSRGMTRLDLLGGRHRFSGLSESEMGYDVWAVSFV
ncbi:hypothetical protein FB451DRAFT_1529004 [Mycena latifolia]|nr:hypothetical protein FB451DRAFT_1529004 [Mycena latifolia]